jgi:spoIIIJ-associated protein
MSESKYTTATVGAKITNFLKTILDAAGLRVSFDVLDGAEAKAYFEQPSLVVKFAGPDVEFLMSNKGEALLALEQLTQEVLRMGSDEHARMCFDAQDLRLRRREELRLSALAVAERVKEGRVPYRFNPMSSRERRIIHLALRDETTLRSESSGVGPGRHVVVYPAGMPSLPDVAPAPPVRRPPRPSGPSPRGPHGRRPDHRGPGGDRPGGFGGHGGPRRPRHSG